MKCIHCGKTFISFNPKKIQKEYDAIVKEVNEIKKDPAKNIKKVNLKKE